MRGCFLFLLWLMLHGFVFPQGEWSFARLADLPFATTENVLTSFSAGTNNKMVYSFGGVHNPVGIPSIHKDVYKYHVSTNAWELAAKFNDSIGRIGMTAATVNNRIYLIGGRVFNADSSGFSSNIVSVYNPFLDTFEVNASAIPIPVDYAVGAVWRDSLILVVSGRSSDSLTGAVQWYNPYFNSWQQGTPVPNDSPFKVIGASGYILGDTLFYYGGSASNVLPISQNALIKGYINPDNPLEIEWEAIPNMTILPRFRSVCSGHGDKLFWYGGTISPHDFLGRSTLTETPVFPTVRLISKQVSTFDNLIGETEVPIGQMGSGSAAKLGGGNWMVAGGLDSLQQATSRTYLMTNFAYSDIDKALQPPLFEVREHDAYYEVITENVGRVLVVDATGRILFNRRKQLANLLIDKTSLQRGLLIFVYNDGSNVPVAKKKMLMR